MLTVSVVVALGAFVLACIGAVKPAVLWTAVALEAVALLLQAIPR